MGKTNVLMPSAGEGVSEGTIVKLLFRNGAVVEKDDPIIEVESSKATMEVTAPLSGKVTFTVKVGDTVIIGAIIAEIDTD